MAAKQDLTVQERIKSAYLHYVKQIEQHDIATAFEVNGGRVNEACLAIDLAARYPKEVRKLCEHLKARDKK
jgi:hypothetical protein